MKKLATKIILSKYFCFIFILFNGCKTQTIISEEDRFIGISNFDSLSYPVKLSYNATVTVNNKISTVKGFIKINSSNNYFMNAYSTTYGIEVFKLVVQNDSLFFVNKAEKKYFKGLQKEFNYLNIFFLNEVDLIRALTGSNCFNHINFTKDTIITNDSTIHIQYTSVLDKIFRGEAFYKQNKLLYKQAFVNNTNKIILGYENSRDNFSVLADLFFLNNERYEKIQVYLLYTSADFSKYENFIVTIPNGYERLK